MDYIARVLKRVSLWLTSVARGRCKAVCPAAGMPRVPAPVPPMAPVRTRRMFDAPYFRDPVFADERDMVRLYVVLHQQERQRQVERRRALALALDGIDVWPRWIPGVEVAR